VGASEFEAQLATDPEVVVGCSAEFDRVVHDALVVGHGLAMVANASMSSLA